MKVKWEQLAKDSKTIGDAFQPLVLIVSAITAAVTFVVSEQNKAEDRAREARDRAEARSLPFYQKQLDIYAEAARVSARLASIPESDPAYPAVVGRFWELYWGDLSFVESSDVAARMVNICRTYVSARNPQRCTTRDEAGQGLAIDLARQAAQEIKARWAFPQ